MKADRVEAQQRLTVIYSRQKMQLKNDLEDVWILWH